MTLKIFKVPKIIKIGKYCLNNLRFYQATHVRAPFYIAFECAI